MAVTTRRPVIGPQQSSAYVYLHGQFFWSLDSGRHAEILNFLENQGISRQEINQGVFGAIYNVSEDEVPDYVNEEGSDMLGTATDPNTLAECKRKLQALFPDLRDQTGYNVQSAEEIPYSGGPKFDVGDEVICQGFGEKGRIYHPILKEDGWWYDVWFHPDYEPEPFTAEFPEKDLSRAGQHWDQPGGWKVDDLGIPPQGEDYYRNARKYAIIDGMDEPLATDSLTQELGNNASAKTAFERLSAAGGQVYVVGGAVRDALMGKSPKDIDLMVAGLTGDQIIQTLKGEGAVNLTGKDFGVYRFKAPGASDEVEIALPRSEKSTGSGHKDFEVNADPFLDPSVDLSRRDFTINAMAWHPETRTFLDPHGGMNDLKQGNLTLVSDNAFEDDPLRIVRALVATARYGFTPDSALVESMQEHAAAIRHLPGERIQMELDKLLSAPDPAQAFELAEQTGVLDYIAPELTGTVGFDQRNPHHNLDVWKHTLQVLRAASQLSNDPDFRLAALFHDSGKPDSFWLDPNAPEGGGGHFYKKRLDDGSDIGQDHQEVGGDLVTEFMNRLRYPKKRIERVETLVRNHMFPYFNSAKAARKFLRMVDNDPKTAFDLLNLRQADASGKIGGEMNEYDTKALEKARALVTQVLDEGENISKTDLAINGNDLIQLGYKPGPQFREILNKLHDAVIEDPSLNNRDDLLGLLNV